MEFVLLGQLAATATALGWVPGNPAKLAAMVGIWGLGFRYVTAAELLMMAGVNALFVLMDWAAIERGVFCFDHPDFLGLPVYEYAMWGFYTLHAIRLLAGKPAGGGRNLAAAAAMAFALPFATIVDSSLLLFTSAIVLAACIALFHQRMDFAYAGYMAALGALIEHVGVGAGQWHYPSGMDYGNVPLWSLTMWAGVGLFTRRLILPVLYPSSRR